MPKNRTASNLALLKSQMMKHGVVWWNKRGHKWGWRPQSLLFPPGNASMCIVMMKRKIKALLKQEIEDCKYPLSTLIKKNYIFGGRQFSVVVESECECIFFSCWNFTSTLDVNTTCILWTICSKSILAHPVWKTSMEFRGIPWISMENSPWNSMED